MLTRCLAGVLAGLGLSWLLVCAAQALPPGMGELVWADEFNGKSLDSNKWAYYPWSTRDDAHVSANAVSVADGLLHMQVYTENGQHYTGFITTAERLYDGSFRKMLFDTAYGYFEVKAKFHSSPGMWSAFWCTSTTIGHPVGDPENAGMEIDIVEHRAATSTGSSVTSRYNLGLHWDGYGSDHKQSTYLTPSQPGLANDTWHTYGLRWTPDSYSFYYDDKIVWTAPSNVPISQRAQYLLLSSEVRNNSWAGVIPTAGYGSKADSPNGMFVDYVRVYEYEPTPEPGTMLLLAGPLLLLANSRRARFK